MTKRRQILIQSRMLLVCDAVLVRHSAPLDGIYDGLPFTREDLRDPKVKVPWDDFVEYIRRCEVAMGGPEGVRNAVPRMHDLPGNEFIRDVARYFADVRSMYWALAKWCRLSFPCVTCEYESLEDGRVRMTMRIDDDQAGSTSFFNIWYNGMRTGPAMIGLPNSVVDVEMTDREAVYTIHLAPAKTIFARARVLLGSFVAARATINELSKQKEEVEQYYQQLLEAQRKVQEQESQLKLSSQMAALSNLAALGEMAAAVSHEINNPLMVLYLKTGLLKRRVLSSALEGSDRAPLLELAHEIDICGSRIASITRGLLAFAGETHGEPRASVPVGDIVADTLKLCGEKLRNAGVQVRVMGAEAGLRARCNQAQISHALLNILSNSQDAIQSMPASERWIRIDCRSVQADKGVEIAISDSGPGVPEETRSRIFEPFFTTKEFGKGTGLSLSVSRGLIEANEGRIELETDGGRTRFVITLPAAETISAPADGEVSGMTTSTPDSIVNPTLHFL